MGGKESLILKRFPNNSEKAQSAAADKLVSLLSESLQKNSPVLLLLSSGTWIPALDKANYSELITNTQIKNLTFTTLDERGEIGPNNNFDKIVNTSFFNSLIKSGAHSIATIPFNNESSCHFAERINKALKDYLSTNPDAVLIATAGVGGRNNVPGHIAGIEPRDKEDFKHLFRKFDILYQGYIAKHLNPDLRTTATFSLLNKVDHFVLLILDPEQKRQSLDLILSKDRTPQYIAPCVYFRNRANTTIFTDIPE